MTLLSVEGASCAYRACNARVLFGSLVSYSRTHCSSRTCRTLAESLYHRALKDCFSYRMVIQDPRWGKAVLRACSLLRGQSLARVRSNDRDDRSMQDLLGINTNVTALLKLHRSGPSTITAHLSQTKASCNGTFRRSPRSSNAIMQLHMSWVQFSSAQ